MDIQVFRAADGLAQKVNIFFGAKAHYSYSEAIFSEPEIIQCFDLLAIVAQIKLCFSYPGRCRPFRAKCLAANLTRGLRPWLLTAAASRLTTFTFFYSAILPF